MHACTCLQFDEDRPVMVLHQSVLVLTNLELAVTGLVVAVVLVVSTMEFRRSSPSSQACTAHLTNQVDPATALPKRCSSRLQRCNPARRPGGSQGAAYSNCAPVSDVPNPLIGLALLAPMPVSAAQPTRVASEAEVAAHPVTAEAGRAAVGCREVPQVAAPAALHRGQDRVSVSRGHRSPVGFRCRWTGPAAVPRRSTAAARVGCAGAGIVGAEVAG